MGDRMIQCPECRGRGELDMMRASEPNAWYWIKCYVCKGSGTIPDRRKPSEIDDALRAEVAALKARLAKFEGPLTDEQMRLARERWKAMENDGTDYGNVRNWDAAIRAAREGER